MRNVIQVESFSLSGSKSFGGGSFSQSVAFVISTSHRYRVELGIQRKLMQIREVGPYSSYIYKIYETPVIGKSEPVYGDTTWNCKWVQVYWVEAGKPTHNIFLLCPAIHNSKIASCGFLEWRTLSVGRRHSEYCKDFTQYSLRLGGPNRLILAKYWLKSVRVDKSLDK
jgi:hypothetical protein